MSGEALGICFQEGEKFKFILMPACLEGAVQYLKTSVKSFNSDSESGRVSSLGLNGPADSSCFQNQGESKHDHESDLKGMAAKCVRKTLERVVC